MSARVPNSFELIVRGFLQNAVFAGPFEVKLSRYALLCFMSMLPGPCWDPWGPAGALDCESSCGSMCVSHLDAVVFFDCMYQYELLYGCLLCTSITSSSQNPSDFIEASVCRTVLAAYMHWSMQKRLFCRILGLSKGWKRLYCALVPFSPAVGTEATELQLMFIDESALTLVDKVVVTECRSEACATRARLHIDLVSSQTWTKLSHVYFVDCCL